MFHTNRFKLHSGEKPSEIAIEMHLIGVELCMLYVYMLIIWNVASGNKQFGETVHGGKCEKRYLGDCSDKFVRIFVFCPQHVACLIKWRTY